MPSVEVSHEINLAAVWDRKIGTPQCEERDEPPYRSPRRSSCRTLSFDSICQLGPSAIRLVGLLDSASTRSRHMKTNLRSLRYPSIAAPIGKLLTSVRTPLGWSAKARQLKKRTHYRYQAARRCCRKYLCNSSSRASLSSRACPVFSILETARAGAGGVA